MAPTTDNPDGAPDDDPLPVRLARSPRTRLGMLGVILVAGATAAIVLAPSRSSLQDAVDSTGAAGPLVYMALYVALTVALVPGALLTAAGGLLFGAALATGLTVFAATAAISFRIGRRLGRRQVEQIAGPKLNALDGWITRNGFVAVLYMRLVPLVPFSALNYAAGVTGVQFRSYVAATALGIIPGTFAYSALGGSFDEPSSPEFIAAVVLIVVLAGGAPFAQRVARRRGLVPDTERPREDASDGDPSQRGEGSS